jgi:hypothetical protein
MSFKSVMEKIERAATPRQWTSSELLPFEEPPVV